MTNKINSNTLYSNKTLINPLIKKNESFNSNNNFSKNINSN